MSDIESMWWCKDCETWVGYELDECVRCNRKRLILPVVSDNVPFKHSKDVTLKHRLFAKTLAALNQQ